MIAAALVAALLMLIFLSVALWWAIGHLLDSNDPMLGWSALIVGVIWAIITAILALVGKSSLQKVEGVPQTTETVSQIPNALKGEEAQNR